MTKREAKRALREEISRLIESGLPVPVQLVRLARAQGGLKGVTPRFMVLARSILDGGNYCYVALREDGVTCVRDGDEVHDMWRKSQVAEDRVSLTWPAPAGPTPEDDAEWAKLKSNQERWRAERFAGLRLVPGGQS